MEVVLVKEAQIQAKPVTIGKAANRQANRRNFKTKRESSKNSKTGIQSRIQQKLTEELKKQKKTKEIESKKKDAKQPRKRIRTENLKSPSLKERKRSERKERSSDSKKKEKKREQKSKNKRNTSASIRSNASTPSKRSNTSCNKRGRHEDDVVSNHSYSLRSRGPVEPLSTVTEIISEEDISDKFEFYDSPEVRVNKRRSKIGNNKGLAALGNFIPLSPLTPDFYSKNKKSNNNRENKNTKIKDKEIKPKITRSRSKLKEVKPSNDNKSEEIINKIEIFEEIVEPPSKFDKIMNGIKSYGKLLVAGVLSLGLIGLFTRNIH